MEQAQPVQTFGEALQAKLRAEDINQSELAAQLRVTPSAISRIINGKRKGSGEVIVAICARWPDLLSFFTPDFANSQDSQAN